MQVRITDEEWLSRFQHREVAVFIRWEWILSKWYLHKSHCSCPALSYLTFWILYGLYLSWEHRLVKWPSNDKMSSLSYKDDSQAHASWTMCVGSPWLCTSWPLRQKMYHQNCQKALLQCVFYMLACPVSSDQWQWRSPKAGTLHPVNPGEKELHLAGYSW